MQAAAVKAPHDFEVLGAYGKALADDGQLEQAKEVLASSYTPERPDWTIMSVQGSVADRLGDHEGAQTFYRGALKIAPGEPSVLSNLGLSYALTKQLARGRSGVARSERQPARRRARATESGARAGARRQVRRGRADQPAGHDGAGGERQCRGDQADDRAERFVARAADRRRSSRSTASSPRRSPRRRPAAAAPPARRLRSASRKARRSGRRSVALRRSTGLTFDPFPSRAARGGRLRLRLRRCDRRRRRPDHPAGVGARRPRSRRRGGDQQARRGVRLRLVDAGVCPRRQDRRADHGRPRRRGADRLGLWRARPALRAASGARRRAAVRADRRRALFRLRPAARRIPAPRPHRSAPLRADAGAGDRLLRRRVRPRGRLVLYDRAC